MATALFEVDGDRIVPTELTRGPWDAGAMNGGAVAALVARAAERHDDEGAPRRDEHVLARLNVDLVRPVPLAPLTVRTRTARPGRKVQLVEIAVLADETVVTRGLALRMPTMTADWEAVRDPVPEGPDTFAPLAHPGRPQHTVFHLDGVEVRTTPRPERGGWAQRRPVWVRLRHPLVEGEPVSPACRAATASDFASGITGISPEGWRSINVDVNVQLFAPPQGEWICFHARSTGRPGVAIAEGHLFDEHGQVGHASQTVLVEPYHW